MGIWSRSILGGTCAGFDRQPGVLYPLPSILSLESDIE